MKWRVEIIVQNRRVSIVLQEKIQRVASVAVDGIVHRRVAFVVDYVKIWRSGEMEARKEMMKRR